MIRDTRPISWVKAALHDFLKFPKGAQLEIRRGLTVAAEGRKAENAKPMKGLGAGVFEIAMKYKTNVFRTVYALQLDDDIWVVHVFEKKATSGIKTPKKETDLIKKRMMVLREMLK